MSREIKFRAKRLDSTGWVYGYYVEVLGDSIIFDGVGHEFKVDEKTVGQFTGLIDKSGKEIYEGDIVKDKTFERPLFVKWDYDGFYLFENICNEASIDEKICEVIGNIYENPNLLTH